MTYEQYLEKFVADVIKATGMLFDHGSTSISKVNDGVTIAIDNDDVNYGQLSVTLCFDSNATVAEFEKKFAAHREAAVRLTAMAHVAQVLFSVTLHSRTGSSKRSVCDLRMHDNKGLSISETGDYDYFDRYWSGSTTALKKTYAKPNKMQIASFAKNTFLKEARDDAAADVEHTIERLKEFHEDYVRQHARLRSIDELLS